MGQERNLILFESRLTYDILFNLEDVVVKEHVQLLVGVVDAELFERVCGKIFKSEDVQYPDKLRHIFS